jgi:single-stranded-DNA-specific exonuclease
MTLAESRWIGSGALASGSLLERVMASRSYAMDARGREVLHAPRLDLLHRPRTLPGATEVAVRLEAAVRAGRRVAIYGDYDADGITATAVLWRAIRAVRPDADLRWYVPDRVEEGYGLNDAALESLAADGVRTVVTVDCGASALEQSRRARELGLELLVTDHHHVPPGRTAEAEAIAHPALPGRDPAPFADLCGAAVAFKVAQEFARAWCGGDNVAEVLKQALAACLPLVAVASVADVVPLVDENRIFVSRGLHRVHGTAVPGLRALLDDADLSGGRRVQSGDVGFRIGPRLNAVGRLGHARDAVELLLTEDPAEARRIARRLSEVNERRRAMDKEHFAQAEALVAADPSLAAGGAIVLADARWHEGVVGISAAKVAERWGKPAILLAVRGDGTAKGSGRSVEGIDILDAVTRAAGDLVVRGGGHAFALGVTVRERDVPEFARRVAAECAARTAGSETGPVLRYDAEAAPEELSLDAVKALDILRPYGRGNPEPAFLLRGARPVAPPGLFGGDRSHVEFFLPGGARAVWWGAARRAAEVRQGVPIDLIVRPELDTYRNSRRVQATVVDLRPAR